MKDPKVYFIGAGPGDPELITVKGKSIIEKADLIVYAGSLVNPDVLRGRKKKSILRNSAEMALEEITDAMIQACKEGKTVARVHTGDPAIYGAINEQMEILDREGIEYEVVPGVSSFLAAAAALRRELTVPGISQTVILTRRGGRTKTPESESLASLAKHQATMAIFLSLGMAGQVQKDLLAAYPPDTPVAIVYKASWKDQKIFMGSLKDLAKTARKNKITGTALILIGKSLGSQGNKSKLYDKNFAHGFRKKKKMKK
jgi:precorrin-4/cobalt-precorrin-4 C11-methyltransferase